MLTYFEIKFNASFVYAIIFYKAVYLGVWIFFYKIKNQNIFSKWIYFLMTWQELSRRNIDFVFQEIIIRSGGGGKTNKFSLRKQGKCVPIRNRFETSSIHKILQEDAFPRRRQFTTNGKICSEHAHMSVGGRFVAN